MEVIEQQQQQQQQRRRQPNAAFVSPHVDEPILAALRHCGCHTCGPAEEGNTAPHSCVPKSFCFASTSFSGKKLSSRFFLSLRQNKKREDQNVEGFVSGAAAASCSGFRYAHTLAALHICTYMCVHICMYMCVKQVIAFFLRGSVIPFSAVLPMYRPAGYLTNST
jgi:hypothetical protein